MVIGLFGSHMVRTGRLDAEHGRALNRAHQLRNLADYDVGSVDVDKTDRAVGDAERLVAAVRALIAPTA